MAKRQIRLLLIEDMEDTVLLTREYLNMQGNYGVEAVGSLGEAIENLTQTRYDAILLDYNLPDATGLQSLEFINSLNVDTPVIMVTARGDEQVAVKSVKAGAADYIVKTSNYLGTLADVINRVVQQHELRRAVSDAEDRYRYLFEQANDAILICDELGTIVDANHNASEWLRIERDALIGRNLADFEHPDGAITSERLRDALLREGELVYELDFQRASGELFAAEVSARQVLQGESIFSQYIVRDITHRKAMEAEILRRSKELAALSEVTAAINRSLELNEVLNAALDGVMGALENTFGAIYLQNPDNEFTLAAQRGFSAQFAEQAFVQTRADLAVVEMPPQPGVVPDWLKMAGVETFLAVPLISRSYTLGYLVLGAADRAAFSGDEYNFTRVNCDRIAAAIENARLLGELQQSIEATRLAQAQLVRAARLSAVGELAAGVAHQINNPLTTVIADAQLLLKTLNRDHAGYVSAEAIYQAGWRAQRVVQRLLNFARPQDEVFEPTHINETIRAALDLLGAYLQRQGLALNIVLNPNLPQILASGHQLEEMWINLLLNAREALHGRPNPTIGITSQMADDDNSIEVRVSDNGVGIDAEQLNNVFEPFYTTRQGDGGTGLGLAVCQTIVQHHHGVITARSKVGMGTTFIVRLPLTQENARRQPSRSTLVEDVLNSKETAE